MNVLDFMGSLKAINGEILTAKNKRARSWRQDFTICPDNFIGTPFEMQGSDSILL